MLNRVVITGIGAVTAFGKDWQNVRAGMLQYQNAVRYMPEWEGQEDLNALLGAPIDGYQPPKHWTRKQLRSLGPVSQMCVEAGERALTDAGLAEDPAIQDGRMGVASGSSTGSTKDICDLAQMILYGKAEGFSANTYIRMMPHTTAANLAIFFGLKGRLIPTSSACTSGSQAIGYAYESIKYGQLPLMLAGGGEELCLSEVAVFDSLYAASLKNTQPKKTPAPYDKHRDGLVIGEGAGMFVLESLEHARARGAKIYAEIVAFACNCDGTHVTRPEKETMFRCMQTALQQAGLSPAAVGYVSGHGTATEQGDIAETLATARLFPKGVALSSQKSYFGHTLGACGVLESWFAIEMMRDKCFMPTINLTEIDPRCGELDYITQQARRIETEYVMNNNFAFGGVNTSLIFKHWS